jgi:hypothetical protein
VVSAGTKGNLYIYDGSRLELYRQIKGNWNTTNKAVVNTNAVLNFHGLPLFGLSKSVGTGVKLGVYSFGRTNAQYPYVLALDFPISTGNLTNVEIGAIGGNGDSFYVSWKDTTTGTVYGIDYLNNSAVYASGYFTTRLSLYDRTIKSTYKGTVVAYRTLPALTEIEIWTSKNHGAFAEEATEQDVDRLILETYVNTGTASVMQTRVYLKGSANLSPEVEMLDIEVE